MASYRYLIVGGGLAADGACKGIRDVDEDGSIGVVGSEAYPPYLRPPLSKGLWKGDPEEKIWRGTADLGVDLHVSRTVVSLDLRLVRPPTARAGPTRTNGCCSRRVAGRAGCRSEARRSSTTGRSTTTGTSARSPIAGNPPS